MNENDGIRVSATAGLEESPWLEQTRAEDAAFNKLDAEVEHFTYANILLHMDRLLRNSTENLFFEHEW